MQLKLVWIKGRKATNMGFLYVVEPDIYGNKDYNGSVLCCVFTKGFLE
jgi:hypothetical protein